MGREIMLGNLDRMSSETACKIWMSQLLESLLL